MAMLVFPECKIKPGASSTFPLVPQGAFHGGSQLDDRVQWDGPGHVIHVAT